MTAKEIAEGIVKRENDGKILYITKAESLLLAKAFLNLEEKARRMEEVVKAAKNVGCEHIACYGWDNLTTAIKAFEKLDGESGE